MGSQLLRETLINGSVNQAPDLVDSTMTRSGDGTVLLTCDDFSWLVRGSNYDPGIGVIKLFKRVIYFLNSFMHPAPAVSISSRRKLVLREIKFLK